MTHSPSIENYDLINVREDGFVFLQNLVESLTPEVIKQYQLPLTYSDLDKHYQGSLKSFMQIVFPHQHQKLIRDFRKKWHIPEWQGFMQYSESTYLSPKEFELKKSVKPDGDYYYFTIKQDNPPELIQGYPVQFLQQFLQRDYIRDTSREDNDSFEMWKTQYEDPHMSQEFMQDLIDLVDQITETIHLNPAAFYNTMLDFILHSRVSAFHLKNALLYTLPPTREIDGDLYIKVIPTMSVQEYTDYLKQVLPNLLEFSGMVQDKYDPMEYRQNIREYLSKGKKGDYKLLNDRIAVMRKGHSEWFPKKNET